MSEEERQTKIHFRFLSGLLCNADDTVVTRIVDGGLLDVVESWWGMMVGQRTLMIEGLDLVANLVSSGTRGKMALVAPRQRGVSKGRGLIHSICDMIKQRRPGGRKGVDGACFIAGIAILSSLSLSRDSRPFLWRGSLLADVADLWATTRGDIDQRVAILRLMTNVATAAPGRKKVLHDCLLLIELTAESIGPLLELGEVDSSSGTRSGDSSSGTRSGAQLVVECLTFLGKMGQLTGEMTSFWATRGPLLEQVARAATLPRGHPGVAPAAANILVTLEANGAGRGMVAVARGAVSGAA